MQEWRRVARPVSPTRHNIPEIALSALLFSAVLGSVLAIGSVHLPALLCVSVVSIAAATLTPFVRAGRAVPWPAVMFLALAAYTLVQTLPLPIGSLAAIAPRNADVWQRSLLPFGEAGPRWAPASLDPGASSVEALKWLTYACVFTASAALATRRGARWGVATVYLGGLAAALTTVIHGLAGATSVFGLYQPKFAVAPWHVGPLLNSNNLAGYLNLSALCGLGLLHSQDPPMPRWAIGLGVATIAGVAVTSASRGGVLLLPVGMAAFATILAFWHSGRKREASQRAIPWLVMASVGGGGAILALLGGTEETWRELYNKNLVKLQMLGWAKPVVIDHPWLGIGRGSFESVFPAYRTEPGNVVYAHAESFPAQWVSEWGAPVGIAALLAFAWLMRPGRLGVGRSSLAAGVWVGVAILALQNMVDLALEVPGVTIGATVALGSVWGAAAKSHAEGDGARRLSRRAFVRGTAAVTAVVGAALLWLAAARGWHSVASDRADAFAAFERWKAGKHPPERAEVRDLLRTAMLRHPAEPYFPLIGGLTAWGTKEENPLPWLARALERSDGNGRAHLLLAEVLASRGHHGQAMMELRLAVEREAALAPTAAQVATRFSDTYDTLVVSVPEGAGGAAMLEALAAALRPKQGGAVRERLLADSLARDPNRLATRQAIANDLFRDLSAGDQPSRCQREKRPDCLKMLEGHIRVIEATAPELSAGPRARAQLLLLDGRPEEAEQHLLERCDSVNDRAPCLYDRMRAAAASTQAPNLGMAVKAYLAVRCARADDCAEAAAAAGDLYASRGEWGTAATHYGRATRDGPNEARWLKLAEASARIGAHAQAAACLERVARLRGHADAELRQRIETEKAAATGNAP